MIKVIVGTNTQRESVITDPSMSLRSVLEDKGIDYATGTIHLDGTPIKAGDLDQTFAGLGITEKCYLVVVVKGDGGLR